MNNRLINTKVAGGGGGCTDIVDNYDPFGGNGVALYQLNGDATDVSGNYDGTASNVTYGTGVFGQAGVFNGSSSMITLPSALSDGATMDASCISFWFNVGAEITSATSNKEFMSFAYSGGSTGKITGGATTGAFTGETFSVSSDVTSQYTYSKTNIPAGWNHAVVQWNSGNTKWDIYINGVAHTTYTFGTNEQGKFALKFGNRNQFYYEGKLDQVRIFNTALTPLEVEALYTEELCICDGTVDTLDILGDTSCIATYQLDGNANDLSGNYSGTPTNVSYGVGEFDLAGVFNGSSSYIDIPTMPNITGAGSSVTFSSWINFDGSSGDRFIISLRENSFVEIGFNSGYSPRKLEFKVNDGSNKAVLVDESAITYNTWHHVCLTAESGGLLTAYLDGVNKGNIAIGNIANAGQQNSIGAYSFGTPAGYFTGSIDQVRIFNKALSAGEVTTLYNETACTKAACTGTTNTLDILGDSSCIAAYPLDGSPADLSGNYNGVISGTGSFRVGKFDLSYANNSTSGISCPPFGISGSSATFSASMWINFDTLSFGQNFIMVTGSNTVNSTYALGVNTSGNMLIDAYGNAYFFNNTPVIANQWYHIVGVSNGSNHKLYINGSLAGEINQSLTFVSNFSAIGGRSIDNSTIYPDALRGSIDQVRIFNKALSAGEVTTLYNETPCN